MKPLLFPRDLLRFLYWVFFKPITLERFIRQVDPTLGPSTGIFVLWKRSKDHSEFCPLTYLALFHIVVTPWLVAFIIAGTFALGGFNINWLRLAVVGAAGIVISIVIGVAKTVLGVTFSLMFGALNGILSSVIGMLFTALGIFGAPLVGGVLVGVAFGMVISQLFSYRVTFILIGSATLGVVLCLITEVAFGMGVGVGLLIGGFQIFNYLIEAPYSFFLSRFSIRRDLRLSPVMWDELIWLPLPGLDRQLVAIGKKNRQEGMKAIDYVASSFRQGWAARRALYELMADDVRTSKNLESIAAIGNTLSWLPSNVHTSFLLLLETVSKYARAALESDTSYNRQEQLRFALNETQSLRHGLSFSSNKDITRLMPSALEVWETLLADELAAAQKQESIPNVYVAGRPLDTKSKVFRGRRDVFKSLEQELISPAEQRPAILLFGARRTGKTSVLRQLPETLGPQVIPVAVDLQDAALEKDVAGLLYKIAKKIRSDALLFRRFEFGELSRVALDANPYSAFADWLQKLQENIGERWILLNLDEYEYLEKMLNDRRVDDRIFQMLRTLLQNHARLTLLLSGAHTFEDLSPIWSHHLINARVIKINPLNEDEARELITKPIANYPLVYTEGAVKDMLEATACQPYLIQAVCRDLVNMKNDTHHFHANSKDVLKALESVLVSATAYFQDLWEGPDTDQAQQTVMGAIARVKGGSLSLTELNAVLKKAGFEQTAKVRQRALRVLEHRDILKSNKTGWSFQIPLVRTWIRVKQFGLKK